jgi:raffinose/stachyose/melibiose transport system substrate-binding protein
VRSLTQYRRIVQVAAVAVLLLLNACAPGGNSDAGPAPSKPVSTGVGSEPVTLKLLVNSGVDVPFYTELGELFHAKYDNVTVKVENQDYATLTTTIARILAGSNVPDLVRVSQLGNLIEDRLLTSLDPYAKAYGWDQWPQSQFASTRVGPDGKQRGTGALYAAGAGFARRSRSGSG